MSEIESDKVMSEAVEVDTTGSTSNDSVAAVAKKPKSMGKTIAAVIIVVVIMLGVLYKLEKDNRSSTNIFGSLLEQQFAQASVAAVNGARITNADLETGVQQFSQMAAAQGVDVTNPAALADIRNQALDVLINTELLKQTAEARGLGITEEMVSERLSLIETEIGGADVLAERMASLGIDEDKLHSDIKDEILIQQLLDTVFNDEEIDVTEEELTKMYEAAGGEEAGLPEFSEVRDQIEAQVRSSKEQEIIDAFLAELKVEADIEIMTTE